MTGAVAFNILTPNLDSTVNRQFLCLSDGGSSTQQIRFLSQASDEKFAGLTDSNGESAGFANVAGDVSDGVIHALRGRWAVDNLIVTRDGVDGTADTDLGVPDDLDRIDVGQDPSQGFQMRGVVSNIRIYEKPTKY